MVIPCVCCVCVKINYKHSDMCMVIPCVLLGVKKLSHRTKGKHNIKMCVCFCVYFTGEIYKGGAQWFLRTLEKSTVASEKSSCAPTFASRHTKVLYLIEFFFSAGVRGYFGVMSHIPH